MKAKMKVLIDIVKDGEKREVERELDVIQIGPLAVNQYMAFDKEGNLDKGKYNSGRYKYWTISF